MHKALFFDRDGTLMVDRGYLADPAGVELLPGAREVLAEAIRQGYKLFLFTNQSGVGRGLHTLADAEACNRRLFELLALPAPGFTEVCIAPEHPEETGGYRKPSPRFILEMSARHDLDPHQTWMIGDKLSDVQAGLNAGVRPVLLGAADQPVPAGVGRCADLGEFQTRFLLPEPCVRSR
jgi:D-glycero-D-manno-heptose 1,7-bisphosphate phosphatase